MRLMASGSTRTGSGPAASMVIGWLGWASRAAWPASSARAATSTSDRRSRGGVQVVHAGGGQELIQQPLQLLALPVGHPEQLLLLRT